MLGLGPRSERPPLLGRGQEKQLLANQEAAGGRCSKGFLLSPNLAEVSKEVDGLVLQQN